MNPNFIAYLSSSPEEKEKVDNVPVPYIVEYTAPLEEVSGVNDTSFDLRNVNGKTLLLLLEIKAL